MDNQVRGSLLQMARMIQKPTSSNLKKPLAWDSPPTSDDESEYEPPEELQLHTLQSAVSTLHESMSREAKRQRSSVVPTQMAHMGSSMGPSIPSLGLTPELYNSIFESGKRAGLAQRELPKKCAKCEERKEKNRTAAAMQRMRAKMEREGRQEED